LPELPEVETIARSLRNPVELPFENSVSIQTRPGIVGRVVSSVELFWSRSLVTPTLEEFGSTLNGKAVLSVGRRGKFLVIEFSGCWVFIHLRMSGDIRVEPVRVDGGEKHDRLAIRFTDGVQFVFNDPRKFGRVWLVEDPSQVTGSLGYEPFSDQLTGESFHWMLHSTSRRIKPFLLDQKCIAGLGNIYTDEALFLAGLHPLTPCSAITELQGESLLRSIRWVLDEGIRRNGASIDWVYRGGDFQNYFRVYQRTGEPCSVCGTKIERTVVGQRGTHFCPQCQPLVNRF
jgi:formamidopyrimidine-DNA glycosylase